jgi:hypothetical protein
MITQTTFKRHIGDGISFPMNQTVSVFHQNNSYFSNIGIKTLSSSRFHGSPS